MIFAASRSSSTSGEGDVDETDIGGLKVALVADTPKVMTEANRRLGVFIVERVPFPGSGQQRRFARAFERALCG